MGDDSESGEHNADEIAAKLRDRVRAQAAALLSKADNRTSNGDSGGSSAAPGSPGGA